MNDVFSMIESAMKNTSRHYGDVRMAGFGCGCKILATQGDIRYTVFKELCSDHRIECESLVGKEAVEKMVIKD